MKKILFLVVIFFVCTNSIYASTIENLILLCRGGMNTKQIIKVSGDIEGKLLRQIKTNIESNSSYKNEGTISQYDLIKSVKDGVSESFYKYDLKEYHLCIERMAPLVLGGKTEINGQAINISQSNSQGLIKTPIQFSESNKTRFVFQYARQVENEYIIAFRLMNDSSKQMRFYLTKKTTQLVGEDSGKLYQLKSITGLPASFTTSIPSKGSNLVKFHFKNPSEREPLTFSSFWGHAGEVQNLGVAITFTPSPMNITWLNVETHNYKYTGIPSKQGI